MTDAYKPPSTIEPWRYVAWVMGAHDAAVDVENIADDLDGRAWAEAAFGSEARRLLRVLEAIKSLTPPQRNIAIRHLRGVRGVSVRPRGAHREPKKGADDKQKWEAYESWRESRDPSTATPMWDWLDGWNAAQKGGED